MRTAIVVGNGLTISLLKYIESDLDPSFPFRWSVSTPGHDSLLIDVLPSLKAYVERHNPERVITDFELIAKLVENLPNEPVPTGLSDEDEGALLEMGHYLAVGYGWLQVQMDKSDISDWPWARWVLENHSCLIAALSWNYDLTLERLLEHSKTPYFYPDIPTGIDSAGIAWNRSAVLIAKPHGSTNFVPSRNFQIATSATDGGPRELLTYRPQVRVCAYDGPMAVLRRNELYTIRQVVDIVLPGEWNRFSNHIAWVANMAHEFSSAASTAEHLLIVGFGMADCDRAEFLSAIAPADQLKLITIADPQPSDDLVDVLRDKARQLIHWPDGPYGQVVPL